MLYIYWSLEQFCIITKPQKTAKQKRNLIMSNWQYLIKSFNCPIVHSGPPRDLYIILIAIN